MKKEIRQVDSERGICRCTTTDERHYSRVEPNPTTGLDEVVWRPSVTFIVGFYPKGKQFEYWLKANGADADDIVKAAGEVGHKTHLAVGALNAGEEVLMDAKFPNSETGAMEELTTDE